MRGGGFARPVKSFEISKESAPSEMEAVRSAAWSVLGQKGGHASRHKVDLALAADATCGGAPRDPQPHLGLSVYLHEFQLLLQKNPLPGRNTVPELL